ncbi:hypothetical protein P8605_44880, partial [Streptomyces sp. T-3]|nr:hypothetical protein [Streptomyces sp. T-3]
TALPEAVLARPDGYVAWAGHGGDTQGLRHSLRFWCGPASTAVGSFGAAPGREPATLLAHPGPAPAGRTTGAA